MLQVTCPCLVVFLTTLTVLFAQGPPTECERGVKRHHPSQANAYQVYTREGYRQQWLDYTCPEFTIFDPRQCACVESRNRQQQPMTVTRPQQTQNPSTGRQRVGSDRRQQPLVEQRGNSNIKNNNNAGLPSWRHERQGNEQWHQKGPTNQNRERDLHVTRQPEIIQSNGELANPRERVSKQPNPKDTDDVNDMGPGTLDCYLHRPASEPSHFERWTDEQWVEEDCNWPFYTGLVWNQEACRCEWGPNRTIALPDPENSIPASCLMMLKMTFNTGEIKDEGRNIWLNIQDREHATTERDDTAVGGYAGNFRGASIAIPYFKSNVLGPVFHIGFRFKLCPGQPDTDIPLVHNDCVETEDGPSIAVTYQAWNKRVTVSMRTKDSTLFSEVCTLSKAQTEWTKMDIRYGDNYLEVTADDKVCIESDKFYGPVATNNCPLTLLDETFCGKLDEVIITRGCTEAHAVN